MPPFHPVYLKAPLIFHSLPHKQLAKLLAPTNWNKTLVYQTLVKILSFPQVLELWSTLSLS